MTGFDVEATVAGLEDDSAFTTGGVPVLTEVVGVAVGEDKTRFDEDAATELVRLVNVREDDKEIVAESDPELVAAVEEDAEAVIVIVAVEEGMTDILWVGVKLGEPVRLANIREGDKEIVAEYDPELAAVAEEDEEAVIVAVEEGVKLLVGVKLGELVRLVVEDKELELEGVTDFELEAVAEGDEEADLDAVAVEEGVTEIVGVTVGEGDVEDK